ncbi:MAG: ParB/RepB/Spo0J family partition protein [Rhodospirillales bacterium]|nr:MAG: ParB/RepB/Spo0J family partition protein [Rhodospirillales bacterium]
MSPDESRRRGLGRGLSALLGDTPSGEAAAESGRVARMIPVDRLKPSPYQPRRHFDDEAFTALVGSVREKGVLQPLLVRQDPTAEGHYEIVAGERRWRAAQQARLHEVPAVVKALTDRETLEVALVENLQREDLTPLEEAEAYRRLLEEFGHTQEVLAQAIGKSRSHIANMIRLLGLPEPVRRMLDEGQISAGHARALINSEDPLGLAQEIVRRDLNVRQAEDLTRKRHSAPSVSSGAMAPRDPNIAALESELSAALGLKVTVSARKGGAGRIAIHYGAPEQLDEVLRRLKRD